MAVFLNPSFNVLSNAATFALADACATARGAVDSGESQLAGQFVAIAYTAASECRTGSELLDAVDAALADWYTTYARHCGATVSDKGRVSTADMPADKCEAFKRARNSFNVAKSAITGACKAHVSGNVTIDDGGSLLLDSNGMPRSKSALLKFANDAKKATEGTDLQKAVKRLTAAFAAAGKLSDDDRELFMDTCKAYLANPEAVLGQDDDAE